MFSSTFCHMFQTLKSRCRATCTSKWFNRNEPDKLPHIPYAYDSKTGTLNNSV